MPQYPAIVLLTRPEAQSQRFAAGLAGMKVLVSPVIEIVERSLSVDPRSYDALIFTSENAIRAVARKSDIAGMGGYAVGTHTAEVGAEFGLKLRAAGGSADALVELIANETPSGKLLHLRGAKSHGEVAKRLRKLGIETDFEVVYDQKARPLSAEANALLAEGRRVILPLFSPGSAAILSKACEKASARLVLIAISSAALDAWTGPEPSDSVVAFEPSSQAMRQEILRQTGRSA